MGRPHTHHRCHPHPDEHPSLSKLHIVATTNRRCRNSCINMPIGSRPCPAHRAAVEGERDAHTHTHTHSSMCACCCCLSPHIKKNGVNCTIDTQSACRCLFASRLQFVLPAPPPHSLADQLLVGGPLHIPTEFTGCAGSGCCPVACIVGVTGCAGRARSGGVDAARAPGKWVNRWRRRCSSSAVFRCLDDCRHIPQVMLVSLPQGLPMLSCSWKVVAGA